MSNSTVQKSWLPSNLGVIRFLYPNLTEILIGLIIILGLFLGSFKRLSFLPANLPSILYDLLVFSSLGYVILRRLIISRKIPYSPITPQILLFSFFVTMTIANPILTNVTRGVLGWRFLASGLLLHFLGFYAFDDIRRLRRTMMFFLLIASLVAVYGIVQLVRGYTAVELAWINNLAATMSIAGTGRYRLMATMGGAVDLAFLMALSITILIGHIIAHRRIKFIYLLLLSFMSIAILFTFVRAAWVAVFISILYALAFNFWHIKRLRPLFPIFGILLLTTLIILPISASYIAPQISNPALQERVASLSNPLNDGSMLDRYESWTRIWQLVKKYPLGIGVGMTGATAIRYPDNLGPAGVTMDNSYLKILVETGWIGLILFIGLLLSVVIKGGRIYTQLSKPFKKDALPLLACFIAFIVILFFGEYIELNPGRAMIWIFTGFLFSLPRLQRNSEPQESRT